MRIAIIGSGISGMLSAWLLQRGRITGAGAVALKHC